MLEEQKLIKIGTIVLFIVLIYATVYCLIALVSPDVFLKGSYPGYTGQSWSDFAALNPNSANHDRAISRLAGGFALSVTIAGFFILLTSFRKGQKWSWYCIFFISLIAWVNSLLFGIYSKDTLSIIMDLVGLGLFLVGIIIPAKAFLSK